MKTRKRKRPIEKSYSQVVDLNDIDWSASGSGEDLWTAQFERCEVSKEKADAMFRRVDASIRKFRYDYRCL